MICSCGATRRTIRRIAQAPDAGIRRASRPVHACAVESAGDLAPVSSIPISALFPMNLLFHPSAARALAAASLLSAVPLAADPLEPRDIDSALARLERITREVEGRKAGRLSAAVAAFRGGVASDAAAMDLYLDCLEKVRYTDQGRSAGEFREWKRQNKDRLADSGLRAALRHQLRWLLLGLEAAEKPESRGDAATKALQAVRDVFADARSLRAHRGILRENVFGSVFCQAYEITHLAPRDWPGSPLPVEDVYERLILPPLRDAARLESLRGAWNSRIAHEAAEIEMETGSFGVAEGLTGGETTGGPGRRPEGVRPPTGRSGSGESRISRFMSERRPVLLWQMQIDVFNAGGARDAVTQMLSLIEANVAHRNAIEWTSTLRSLLDGAAAPPPVATTGTDAPDGTGDTPVVYDGPVINPPPAPPPPPERPLPPVARSAMPDFLPGDPVAPAPPDEDPAPGAPDPADDEAPAPEPAGDGQDPAPPPPPPTNGPPRGIDPFEVLGG
jgi:hypothetical protein